MGKQARSGGKIQVESKDDIRQWLGRSTDDGDAVTMAFYGPGEAARRTAAVLADMTRAGHTITVWPATEPAPLNGTAEWLRSLK